MFLYLAKVFLTAPTYTIDDKIRNYIMENGSTPCAITYDYDVNTDMYKVYDVSKKQYTLNKQPLMPQDCSEYVINNKDITSEDESGYTVDGMNNTFMCPKNYIWNTNDKTCKHINLCQDNDKGLIKGIDIYYFYQIIDTVDNKVAKIKNKPYHERLYAACTDEYGGFILHTCNNNYVYNQLSSQPFVVGSTPCDIYDICIDMKDGFIHNMNIPGDYDLKKNEYYKCQKGVSVLTECDENDVYVNQYKSCTRNDQCLGLPNSTTFYNTQNDYIICINGISNIIKCPYGVTMNELTKQYECINVQCFNTPYYLYYINNDVKIPTSVYYCVNNELQEFEPEYDINSYAYKKIDKNNYPDMRKSLYTFLYSSLAVVMVGGTPKSLNLVDEDCLNYTTNNVYTMSYCNECFKFDWDVKRDSIVSGKKYYNFMGGIHLVSDNSYFAKASDCLSFIISDFVYERKATTNNPFLSLSYAESFIYSYYFPNIIMLNSVDTIWIGSCFYFDDTLDTNKIIRFVTVLPDVLFDDTNDNISFYCIDFNLIYFIIDRTAYTNVTLNSFDTLQYVYFPNADYDALVTQMKTYNTVLSLTNTDCYGNYKDDGLYFSCFKFVNFTQTKNKTQYMNNVKSTPVDINKPFSKQVQDFINESSKVSPSIQFNNKLDDYMLPQTTFDLLFTNKS